MVDSLNTSVCGMGAFTEQISVISNNVANVETSAYKSNDVSFADMLNDSVAGSSGVSGGGGVEVQDVSESWNQGSIAQTGDPTDLAINGAGFFCVQDPATGMTYYTRDGNYELDSNGTLVNSNGMAVLGYPIDNNGELGAAEEITISYEPFPPKPTSEITADVNLNSSLETDATFSTTTIVYDSLGNEIPLTTTYTKSAATNTWDWEAAIPPEFGTVSGDTNGTLTFDETGALEAGADPVFILELTNGAAPAQPVTWDLYEDSGNTNGSFTQYAVNSALYDQKQDGYASGELYDVSINEDGVIVGSYSNGETQDLYQIALADFNSYNGLTKVSNNLYEATSDSGPAVMGIPATGQLGSVSAGCLEMSNVDLATELANLITAQRAYQACARVFSVSSEILQTAVNLK